MRYNIGLMAKNLVIVESPAKARTIGSYLGSEYEVASSYGHIRDLPKKGMSIDIEHGFEPSYDIPEDKKKQVAQLRKLAKSAESVWLATDEDREGEAIAWHLCEALKIDPKTTKRIVFHEITKPAIEAAIAKPRVVDQHLVDAQQARRVLDRLVGYELSPVLWKKIRPGLSAGRVQSVAVRLIVEREREIEKFQPEVSYKVSAQLTTKKNEEFTAELSEQLGDATAAKALLEAAKSAKFAVAKLESKPAVKNPSPPFTTSTLQQAAASTLGYSVRQTMVVAQQLYEAGHITYMRTDSLNLAESAISQASKQIASQFGQDYVEARRFKTKTSGAQEAHEAIRPTDFSKASLDGDSSQQKLYQLIWRRAIASQMKPARILRTRADISISGVSQYLIAKGEMVQFDGWLRVFEKMLSQAEGNLLPELKQDDDLDLEEMAALQTYSKPKPRYTEASLVKRLEALGIGRPSTYAPTISTIQARQYVGKREGEGEEKQLVKIVLKNGQIEEAKESVTVGADRGKLFPTDVGKIVCDFLVKYFPKIIDYDFTAKVEDEFDKIAAGKEQWNRMIAEFYTPFKKTVGESENISRHEAIQARTLGTDPKSGKPVIARIGRYGPMLQIGEAEDEEKPKFASLPSGKKLDTVTLEEALELFKLPRRVGTTEKGEPIEANFGRFGPYIKVGSLYTAIKPEDPFTITEAKARELYAEKLKKDAAKQIQIFEKSDIKILQGPYGPYITDGKKNAKIDKDKDPKKLTLKEAEEILKQAPVRKWRGRRKSNTTKKSTE